MMKIFGLFSSESFSKYNFTINEGPTSPCWGDSEDDDPEEVLANANNPTKPDEEGLGTDLEFGDSLLHNVIKGQP